MLRQPGIGMRSVNDTFYKGEGQRIAKLNKIFGNVDLTEEEERVLIWLTGLDDWTIDNLVSAFNKAINANTKCNIHQKLKNNQQEVKSRDIDRDIKQHSHNQKER